MPLTMRPIGLASPGGKDRQDVTVYCGEWAVGRIYEQRGLPDPMFWSLYWMLGKPVDMRTNGHTATLDEAKAQLESTWRQWLAWAKLGEVE